LPLERELNAGDHQHSEKMIQLLTNAQQPLRRYIRTLVPHRADAEDVVQQTNLLLWQHIEKYQRNTDFTAWACKIAYYQVLTLRKQIARHRLRFSDALVEQLATNLAKNIAWSEADVEAFESCMAKLGPQDRELIQLRYEPDATVTSVAKQVGRSTKAVYNAMGRIRTWLLDCIQRSLSERSRS
jgi:RNA polymerase sigma-70 factor, ECF subfamily